MNDFAGIVDVNLAIEAKTFGQFAHAYIFGHIDRDHALDSTLACTSIRWRMRSVPRPLSCHSSLTATAHSQLSPSLETQKRLTPISLFSPASWRSAINAMSHW